MTDKPTKKHKRQEINTNDLLGYENTNEHNTTRNNKIKYVQDRVSRNNTFAKRKTSIIKKVCRKASFVCRYFIY